MSPDLDPAVEAAARALVVDKLGFLAPSGNDEFLADCRHVAEVAVAAAAPLMRAQERAAVRAELLAWAEEDDRVMGSLSEAEVTRAIADRIAPEHTTPREKP